VFTWISLNNEAKALVNTPPEMRPVDSMGILGLVILIMFATGICFLVWVWAVIDTISIRPGQPGSTIQSNNTFHSLLLAIFIGPWTWLYSYNRDWWKLWPALLIGYVNLYFYKVGFGNIDSIDEDFRFDIFLSISLGIWILSILLAIIRMLHSRKIMTTQSIMPTNNIGKSKATSLILAIFVNVFTWLYTYRQDAWKFWVGLTLLLFTILLEIFSLPTHTVHPGLL
jgi:hypothetical protein